MSDGRWEFILKGNHDGGCSQDVKSVTSGLLSEALHGSTNPIHSFI